MSVKINVISCVEKFKNEKFTVFEIKTSDGKTYQAYNEFEQGEHEVDVTANPNPTYPDRIKKVSTKPKFGAPKDYTFEKKKVALECAVKFHEGTTARKETMILETVNIFYEWLK